MAPGPTSHVVSSTILVSKNKFLAFVPEFLVIAPKHLLDKDAILIALSELTLIQFAHKMEPGNLIQLVQEIYEKHKTDVMDVQDLLEEPETGLLRLFWVIFSYN